jgi:leucyl-tRNA synthetase
MADYQPAKIEKKWQQYWQQNNTYSTTDSTEKPKFYVLDMFPYPSGAGLHVGHPLGYIASDIVARYKKMCGYNVLHPMGYDAFGLPAEQYAIQTGQHPAITTKNNIQRYKEQLDKIGFNYDWKRQVITCEPEYYKWTQWIFSQLFNAYYDKKENKAAPIDALIHAFEKEGNVNIQAACDENTPIFTAEQWHSFSEKEKSDVLMAYRLTYLAEAYVNWCPALGCVLANDEVKDGVSERGGYPVERKKMKQWMMRITAYADRLLDSLDTLQWSEALKEMQRNWIGRSYGAELDFKVADKDITLTVFTTRPDTIFGVTYVSIAPEHELIEKLTTPEQKEAVEAYIATAKNRSELDRQMEVKTVSGVFTGSYVINPFNHEKVPLWVADYVLAGYGTGVVMAVPSSDERDFRFAKHFNLPIIPVIEGTENLENPTEIKVGKMINSDFLNGMDWQEAKKIAIQTAEQQGKGKGKVNYRLRDAVFSRQRYWGEPVPIYYKDGIPHLLPENELPLTLPAIDEYKPTADGEPPLARAKNWKYKDKYDYEHTTMPGWAGSSWYFLRYMDSQNNQTFADKAKTDYWNQVDLYVGGTEHAVGHLLYSRFWTKALYDLGHLSFDEPFKRLVNQGMIQGVSAMIRRSKKNPNIFLSANTDNYQKKQGLNAEDIFTSYVPINFVDNEKIESRFANHRDIQGKLCVEAFKNYLRENPEIQVDKLEFINDESANHEDFFICALIVEKMSKSKLNVVNPDDIIQEYGADTLRLYEMFLGPLEQSKPWNTHGIEGVYRFLRKLWNLFHDKGGNFSLSEDRATPAELKILHKTIKKVSEDVENMSFNTTVSAFMVCVNELQELKCNKRAILEDLIKILSPFAPHICEELWQLCGHNESITQVDFPAFNADYLVENTFEYPIQINGKLRTSVVAPIEMPKEDVEKLVLENEVVQKWLEGKPPKKIIVVPKRIVNLVI